MTFRITSGLGKRNSVKQVNQNLDASMLLLSQIQKEINGSIVKPKLSKNACMKHILTIYIKILERDKSYIQTAGLALMTYEYYLNRYGLKVVAERKLSEVQTRNFF
jgi:hypothetical protein